MTKSQNQRLLYIDNLRLLMIIFVVMLHIGVTYSGIGSWYYLEKSSLDIVSTIFFGFFQSFTQGYFMGFLFLIAGYFVPSSYDKKGFHRFIKDRFIRLLIPALLYMLLIQPFIVYFLLDIRVSDSDPSAIAYYIDYISSLKFIGESGPLWFAIALFIFSLAYAFVRLIQNKKCVNIEKNPPKLIQIIVLILLISVSAFSIRLVQPIDTDFLNMQLCFFAQYIILFIVGIKSYRYKWFSNFHYKTGLSWLKAALTLGIIIWIVIMLTGGAINGDFSIYKGGLYWQSAAYALWESFISVSMAIGLITLFREKYNKQNNFIKTLSDNYFAVYVFHAPIIVGLAELFKPIILHPILKFILLCLTALPVCFICTHFILRKIPVLKKIL